VKKMKSFRQPVALVEAWQEAVNQQDIERLLTLSAPDIEIIGPRGAAQGHSILRDWLNRAGLSLTTQRIFARDNVVVLAQHGKWLAAETGQVIGEAAVASCFRVAHQQVVQVARYDDLATALEAGGLTNTDERVDSA
jgi:hypothetical protein